MERSHADTLITELGEIVGLPELALDDGGACTVSVDDGRLSVSLLHDPTRRSLTMMTRLQANGDREVQARAAEALYDAATSVFPNPNEIKSQSNSVLSSPSLEIDDEDDDVVDDGLHRMQAAHLAHAQNKPQSGNGVQERKLSVVRGQEVGKNSVDQVDTGTNQAQVMHQNSC